VPETDRLARGYAQALFAIADAEGSLDDVEDELFRFARTVDREPRLRDALTDPGLPQERKKALLQELLGARASTHTVSILGFLIDQGRGRDLPRIIDSLMDVAAERRRKAVAEVRSAVPLDESQRSRLADALHRATGKDVELKVLVDPGVIGGIVARVGDQVFDGSVKRRLELAREHLGVPR
jgi:F-type H+-transporting ATPase subunit delta